MFPDVKEKSKGIFKKRLELTNDNPGKKDGIKVGFIDGGTVGCTDGDELGTTDGLTLGLNVGPTDGCTDGLNDGPNVGLVAVIVVHFLESYIGKKLFVEKDFGTP